MTLPSEPRTHRQINGGISSTSTSTSTNVPLLTYLPDSCDDFNVSQRIPRHRDGVWGEGWIEVVGVYETVMGLGWWKCLGCWVLEGMDYVDRGG